VGVGRHDVVGLVLLQRPGGEVEGCRHREGPLVGPPATGGQGRPPTRRDLGGGGSAGRGPTGVGERP
jgi:hypothetical protein